MAAVKDLGFIFVGFTVYFLLSADYGETLSDGISTCSSICKDTFKDCEAGFCIRGCRLMTVEVFISRPWKNLDDMKDSCFKDCALSYGTQNASSCAFGCQSQLPLLDNKGDQIMRMPVYSSDDSLFAMSRRFVEYSNRIMNCLLDEVNHQVSVGWIAITSYTSSRDGNSVVIVRSGRTYPHQLASGEVKTSNYVESSLALANSGATEDLRNSQLLAMDSQDRAIISIRHEERARGQLYYSDWLTCMSAKTNLSKVMILLILFCSFAILMWFLVGICFPSTRDESTYAYQKLSIYGDLEYLPVYEEKLPEFKDGKYLNGKAPPLPLKVQKI